MFERFTDRARQVIVMAQEEARGLNHERIGPEHMLLALAKDADSVAGQALLGQDASRTTLTSLVAEFAPRGVSRNQGHIPFTRHAKKSLELALREAVQLGDKHIGTGHLLAGVVRGAQVDDDGIVLRVLDRASVDVAALLDAVNQAASMSLPSEIADLVAPHGPESIGLYLPSVSAALEFAAEESRSLGQDFVGLEHLLLGVIRAADEASDPVASRLLEAMGADLDKMRPLVLAFRAGGESR